MDKIWAIILAGGDGRRLRSLTTLPSGVAIPKQYCSLRGGASLLQKAVQRAHNVVPMKRLCAVTAAQHRLWSKRQLRNLLDDNIIEQPENRGTAHGVLLPLIRIAAYDPEAIMLMLPADHYVRDESLFAHSLRRAATCAARHRDEIYLLGVEPEEPDTELGYIVPDGADLHRPSRLIEFVEKPTADRACGLIKRGALWNTFIVAGSADALLALFARNFASTIVRMRRAVEHRTPSQLDDVVLANLYETLPTLDFSRDVLEGQESRLQVLGVPPCGWSDLGTPQRVFRALQQLPRPSGPRDLISEATLGVDLATQQCLLGSNRYRPPSAPAGVE